MSTIIPGKCEDFDECSGSATVNSATEYAFNCAANSYCLNTIGSHLCICNDGFMGNGMDITGGCSDIDEWLVSKFHLLFNNTRYLIIPGILRSVDLVFHHHRFDRGILVALQK